MCSRSGGWDIAFRGILSGSLVLSKTRFRRTVLSSLSGVMFMPKSYGKQGKHYESITLTVTYDSSREPASEYSSKLPITVLFTTTPDTLHALRKAAHFARQLGASIQILVAHVVPYPLPIDKPRVDPEFRLRQFRSFCEEESIETQIDIRLCRDARQCIHDALRPHSLILIGGGQSWWPLTYGKRLAKRLRRAGHEVVLVSDPR